MKNNFKFLLLAGLISTGLYSDPVYATKSASCDQAAKDIDQVKPKENEVLKSKKDYESIKKIVESIGFDKKLVTDAISKIKGNPTREDLNHFISVQFGQGCLFVKLQAIKYLTEYIEKKDPNLKNDFDIFFKKNYLNSDQQSPALTAIILHLAMLKERLKLIRGPNDPLIEETNKLINEIRAVSKPLEDENSEVFKKYKDPENIPDEGIKKLIGSIRKEIELSEKYYVKLQELYKKI